MKNTNPPDDAGRHADFRDCSLACRPYGTDPSEWKHTLGSGCQVPERDFWYCDNGCRPFNAPRSGWKHTTIWGQCDKASDADRGPVVLHFQRLRRGFGGPVSTWSPLPLTTFLPWVGYLPDDDQQAMLKELAGSVSEARAVLLADWQRTAEQLADPIRRAVLLGVSGAEDFVDAPRPGGNR